MDQDKNTHDLKIWTHFITAQSKLIDRLCAPIPLLPVQDKISSNGTLRVEIDRSFSDEEIKKTIKKHFPKVKARDICLEDDYFLVDNDIYISKDKLEIFKDEIERLYVNFKPFPTLEGVLTDKTSPFKKLTRTLRKNNIPVGQISANELLLTMEGIKVFDECDFIQREQKIGAVYSVEIAYEKLIGNQVSQLLQGIGLKEEDFFVKWYDFMIHTEKIQFASSEYIWLNKQIGLEVIHHRMKIYVDQSKFKGDWERCHFSDLLMRDEIDQYYYEFSSYDNHSQPISAKEYLLLSYHSIKNSYGKDGITKTEFSPIETVFSYNPKATTFNGINSLELNESRWEIIRGRLDQDIFWCNTLKDTISFDFKDENELRTKLDQIKSIEWLDITDYKERHRYKIFPVIESGFDKTKRDLQEKLRFIQFKEIAGGEKMIIRYNYKLSQEEGDSRLRFLNTVNEIKGDRFLFELRDQFKIKFIVERNEQLKEFEENTKYNKIRGAEITFLGRNIGILRRASFPILELKIDPIQIDNLQKELAHDSHFLSNVVPVLNGEIEKVFRLEDAMLKLQTNGVTLPNPSIIDFMFDSSKASSIEDDSIFEEGSNDWKDVEASKLSQHINKSQLRAVLKTLKAKDLALIQGPPGTGKSTVISEIIWQHIKVNPQQRILLTSETHLAVDNAMDKLDLGNNNLMKPIRFGKNERMENEGAKFSLSRIDAWVEDDSELFKENEDNTLYRWMKNIAKRSDSKYVSNQAIDQYLNIWKSKLKNPDKSLKIKFRNAYLDHVNVIGATCSSISDRTSEGKWSSFLYDYCSVFHRESYEIFRLNERDDAFWSAQNKINNTEISFDVVIMDEASKATPPEFSLPLLFGKKSIVVGDHRQLPPMLDEDDFASTLQVIGENELARIFRRSDHNISHFEKLFLNPNLSKNNKDSFEIQYRMHPQINEVIKQFYIDDNGLICGLDQEQVDDTNLDNPQSRHHGFYNEGFITPQTHVIWVDTRTPEIREGTSRVNIGEVNACRKVLKYLKHSEGFQEFQNHWSKHEEKEIGLISFYGRQLHYLGEMAQEFGDEIPLRVRTVDRFQGMERNIIIVSMVRSHIIASSKDQQPDFDNHPEFGYPVQTSLGFAEFPNRLNVALSRAKRLLVIVGNSKHFTKEKVYANVFNTINDSPFDKIIDAQSLEEYC